MKTDGTALYLENQLCFPLYAASRLTTKIYTPLLKEFDLTYPQYLVLLVLWQHGNQTVNEICHRLLLESNTVTPLLKRLEEKKLLQRKRSDKDERVVQISLTKEGEALKQHALSIPDKLINAFADETIDETEIRNLQKTLFKLIDIMNKKLLP
ncbi:MarR family transcriptional regulator [Adhaeribacter sp. BT258]|uniref:MarR family transcriptional regulator n=1 Tax=Adhaeribacter terrigena TaxID=2793070 RepID=A0ABS1C5Y7_9BACT|nr:MarR family transcriptional regulator [Adhaeribacter terrigena]MBK0404774.1 MarR family transcriptional regulator [Adhaeribacter terrigena]